MFDELKSWKRTCLALVLVSFVIFSIQRSSYKFLDPVFETSIFYLPTLTSLVIYYYLNKKQNLNVE